MDNYISLYNRLLANCPQVEVTLARHFVQDSWHELQAKREWSFRRRSNSFAPPTQYIEGSASTNVAAGNPTLITGLGTNWTIGMVGRQIRIGGLLFPFYTIVGWLSPTAILIDQPWKGDDLTNQVYQILQCFYPVPDDFGYFYAVTSIKDSYRLWTNLTQGDLAWLDPQRTNFGQTYAVVFRDYSPQFGGVIGPVLPVTNPTNPSPISTTTSGYSYVANATYIVQVVQAGVTGTSTFQWMRAGQSAFQPAVLTADFAQNLGDGVQIYWPDGPFYVAGDLFIINCQSLVTGNVPRYELWPAPTFSAYLYPYIYIAKEGDLSDANPTLPPFIANRGDVLLEMALQKCAEFPGQDIDHINPYHNLQQAKYHGDKVRDMLIDLERNDEEVGVSLIDYQMFPYYSAPWMTGAWQQTHAPFLNG